MKKVILLFLHFAFLTNLNALDSSVGTDKSKDLKLGKSIEIKKANDRKKSTSTKNSSDNKKDNSSELTFDTFPIYSELADDCVVGRKNISDFNISFDDVHGFNTTKKNYYDSLASAGANVDKTSFDILAFKYHLLCLAANGALMTQANINLNDKLKEKKVFNQNEFYQKARESFKEIEKIKSPQIQKTINVLKEEIKRDCNFFHNLQVIQCGSLIYDFSKNELMAGNVNIFSYGTMFGINTNFKVAVSNSVSSGTEKSNEVSNSDSRNTSMNKSKTLNQTIKSSDDVSVGKVLPSFQ